MGRGVIAGRGRAGAFFAPCRRRPLPTPCRPARRVFSRNGDRRRRRFRPGSSGANRTLGTRASARQTAGIDPKLPFKLGPTNGRNARESGLRLKASSQHRTSSIHTRWFRAGDNNLFRWQTTGCLASSEYSLRRLRSPSSFLNAGVDRYDGGGGEVLAEVNLRAREALAERPWDPDITDVGEAA